MSLAKISIIVPVYNVEEYLPKCLDSLITQTYPDIKIVCVNDGATDNSKKILQEYAKKDARIKVISQTNAGLSAARNTGLKHVDTEYVMFCDSDDYYDKQMCKKMLEVMEKSQADVATCGIKMKYLTHSEQKESDENYYRLKLRGKHIINDDVLFKTDVSVCNKIFRMDLINQYQLTFPHGFNNEDFFFFNTYVAVADTIYHLNRQLYNYVRREGSIMSENFQKDTLSIDHLACAEKIFAFYKKQNLIERHPNRLWKLWIDSYYFSIEKSSRKYRGKINKRAKQFIIEHRAELQLAKKSVRAQVFTIKHGLIGRILRKIKTILKGIYRRISIPYKQQIFINNVLRDLIDHQQNMLDDLLN